jgi:hypothetical protein
MDWFFQDIGFKIIGLGFQDLAFKKYWMIWFFRIWLSIKILDCLFFSKTLL